MEELQTKITYLIFDGKYCAVGESFNPDKKLEEMIKFNLDIDILVDGYNVTRFETDLIFKDFIVQRNDELSWYLLDGDKVELLADMIIDENTFDDYIKSF